MFHPRDFTRGLYEFGHKPRVPVANDFGRLLRLVGRSVRRARDGVILKSTTTKGGLLL
jgi:hypothetical protein